MQSTWFLYYTHAVLENTSSWTPILLMCFWSINIQIRSVLVKVSSRSAQCQLKVNQHQEWLSKLWHETSDCSMHYYRCHIIFLISFSNSYMYRKYSWRHLTAACPCTMYCKQVIRYRHWCCTLHVLQSVGRTTDWVWVSSCHVTYMYCMWQLSKYRLIRAMYRHLGILVMTPSRGTFLC